MKLASPAQIAERGRYYDTLKPYLVVEEAEDGWKWTVYDPRKRTPLGGSVRAAPIHAGLRT